MDAIDLLRGLVIVLMVLDHVKGNIADMPFDFVDLSKTTPACFLTRWVTHICAPVFIFLAGTGAYCYAARGRTRLDVAWFLLSRGLWLVFLELTVIRFSWLLHLDYTFSFGGVLWAIGWSMVALAGLVFLPLSVVTLFGLGMIFLHNLTDGVQAKDWGHFDWLWKILHTGEMIEIPPTEITPTIRFHAFYSLVPWIGVMAVGYGFGPVMFLEPDRRRKMILTLGVITLLLFVVIRYANVYGDKPAAQPGHPGPWSVHEDWMYTVFSFVNCQKYPPSLLFLLMTLGPALILLPFLEYLPGPLRYFLLVFGRVPLFFYLLHWFVIKAVAIGLAWLHYGHVGWFFGVGERPSDAGYSLPVVYLVWIGIVLFFFPLCAWFAEVKRRSQSRLLRYL